MSTQAPIKRITCPQISARKGGTPIVSLTSYHAHTAAIVDRYADFILVGDSLGMVMHGMESTLGVPLDLMIMHGKAVSDAGAFAIVLEGMVEPLAAKITRQIPIPTLGIGASLDCDGQILVLEDMLGLNPGVAPKFVKLYGDLGAQIEKSVATYAEEVRNRSFPGEDHIYR